MFPIFFLLTITKHTRKYAIKILKEIDLNPITGGDKRLVVGGVISLFYCIVLICCSGGIIAKYFLFNERVEATELANISNQNILPESYTINITVSCFKSEIFSYLNLFRSIVVQLVHLRRQDPVAQQPGINWTI